MRVIETGLLTEPQKAAVIRLWNQEYPAQLRYEDAGDFDRYLDGLGDKMPFLATDDAGEIIGWALSFIRGDERWFAIILDRSAQGKGYGAAMLRDIKAKGE